MLPTATARPRTSHEPLDYGGLRNYFAQGRSTEYAGNAKYEVELPELRHLAKQKRSDSSHHGGGGH